MRDFNIINELNSKYCSNVYGVIGLLLKTFPEKLP